MTTKHAVRLAALAALLLPAAGCAPDDPGQVELSLAPLSGREALATYVALGDGLTAGFMDAGLIATAAAPGNGQFASYPAQLAAQIGYTGTAGARPFQQPRVHQPGVGTSDTGDPDLVAGVLRWDAQDAAITLLGATPRAQVPGLLDNARDPVPYDNLGVPGATIHDVAAATGSGDNQAPGNAYFDLILRNPTFGGTTMLQQAVGRAPTLVTLWIGEADILGGARSGEPEIGVNITPPAAFGAMLGQLIADLRAGVRDRTGQAPLIVIGNLRWLTSTPYFVPKSVFDAAVGAAIPTEEDGVVYVLFPTLAAVQDPGFTPPIPAANTLTENEATVIFGALDGYNAQIAAAAGDGVVVVDLAAVFTGLSPAQSTHFLFLLEQGLTRAEAAATTVYSLDGLHPNGHGCTLVANAFIDAINAELGLAGDDAVPHAPAPTWDPTYGVDP